MHAFDLHSARASRERSTKSRRARTRPTAALSTRPPHGWQRSRRCGQNRKNAS